MQPISTNSTDHKILSSYRHTSKLSYISKVMEHVVIAQRLKKPCQCVQPFYNQSVCTLCTSCHWNSRKQMKKLTESSLQYYKILYMVICYLKAGGIRLSESSASNLSLPLDFFTIPRCFAFGLTSIGISNAVLSTDHCQNCCSCHQLNECWKDMKHSITCIFPIDLSAQYTNITIN